ncbi:MAG TPA: hypothetical protein VFA50_00565 [Stellaceae bacterium]|nr:hypothetical protein [Stellaceae bacterium]
MRADGRAGARRWAAHARVALLAAGGVLLVFAGAPRLGAAVAGAAGDRLAARLAAGDRLSQGDLARLVRSEAAAVRWHPSGERLARLGKAQYLLADQPGERVAAPGELRRAAEVALGRGLARAPVDPAAWVALADLELASGATAASSRALALSLQTGASDPALLWRRLDLALAVYPATDAADRWLLTDAVRRAWSADPARTAAIVRNRGAAALAGAALAALPGAGERLAALLAAPASLPNPAAPAGAGRVGEPRRGSEAPARPN